MEQNMFIDGIGICNYRSFGPEVQRIGPFGKINVMVGQNNSGKSNILLFLRDCYAAIFKREKMPFADFDYHEGNKTSEQIVEVGLKVRSQNYEKIIARFDSSKEYPANWMDLIETVLRSQALTKRTKLAWFSYISEGPNILLDTKLIDELYAAQVMSSGQWENLSRALTGRQVVGGGAEGKLKHFIGATLRWLTPCNLPPPKVNMVPAIRSVRAGDEKVDDFSGLGIIDKLARLQNAPYNELDKKKRFAQINEFVQSVLGNRSATLHVPYGRDTIEVEINGRTLPLSNLGTGVHEVIILAAAATVLEKQVVCIEEPELHCHPLLQKQLVKYLQEKTDNQYFISTHSAHLLDTSDAMVFHVRLCGGKSKVENVITDVKRAEICDDLGYRASDLVQANCVVWVEGPSDRIYLNHWIKSVAPELIEGLHYSIMFYGGRLLKHLSASDPDVSDFISLRRLNRHIAIVMDSDCSGPEQEINETKKRVRDEFNRGPGFAWVTKGREIENYIDSQTLGNAIKEIYPKIQSLQNKGPYDDVFDKVVIEDGNMDLHPDKVKVAKKIVQKEVNFDVLDLNENVERLVKFVLESNGMDTAS